MTPAAEFHPTRWSLIIAAGRNDTAARRALEELARTYWYPLYAFARRQGLSPQNAEDLIQSFFADLLQRHSLATVDRSRGRFRAFLLAALKHFLANEFDKARALKRGGGARTFALETGSAESRYIHEPADPLTPEKLFERRWALALLEQVMTRLEADYAARSESLLFTALKPLLTPGPDAPVHAAIARSLDTTEGAVKTAAHRLRRRYRDLLREQIAHTVATDAEIEEEIAYLLKCL